MFTIQKGSYSEKTSRIDSVIRMLVNNGVSKRQAKIAAIQIDYNETFEFPNGVTLQKS